MGELSGSGAVLWEKNVVGPEAVGLQRKSRREGLGQTASSHGQL